MSIPKKKAAPAGAPEWVLTYGDMMSLLLTFFILLASMSEMRQEDEKFQEVMESIKQAFGFKGGVGRMPTDVPPDMSLIKMLLQMVPDEIQDTGDSDDPGIEGRNERVTQVREGLQVNFGGLLQFPRCEDELLVSGKEVLAVWAERIKGHTNMIEVRGHVSLDEYAEECQVAGKDELAFMRAKRIRDIFVHHGVEPRRIRLVSVADREPIVRQAYGEEMLARNRTIEIVISEALLQEYEGKDVLQEERFNHGS